MDKINNNTHSTLSDNNVFDFNNIFSNLFPKNLLNNQNLVSNLKETSESIRNAILKQVNDEIQKYKDIINKDTYEKFSVNSDKISSLNPREQELYSLISFFYNIFLTRQLSLNNDGKVIFENIITTLNLNNDQNFLSAIIYDYISRNDGENISKVENLPFITKGDELYFKNLLGQDLLVLSNIQVSQWLIFTLNQQYLTRHKNRIGNVGLTLNNQIWSYLEMDNEVAIGDVISNLFKSSDYLLTSNDLENNLVAIIAENYLNEFKTNQGNKVIQRFEKHSNKWYDIFEQHGLPHYTAFLSIVESRVDPNRKSTQGAAGYFGFIETTARKYNLKVSGKIDERLDPEKSCIGAAKLIKDEKDYRTNHIKYNLYKNNISKVEHHLIEKGDTIPKLASKYGVNESIILDYNPTITHNKMNIGDVINIPLEYDLTDIKLNEIDNQSYLLALSSYNGVIAKQLDFNDYNDYLDKISIMINTILAAQPNLESIIKKLEGKVSQAEYNNYLNYCINIYKKLGGLFQSQYSNNIFSNRLESLNKLRNSKSIQKSKLSQILRRGSNVEIVVWYENILLQNLIYPANLLAVKQAYDNIEKH